MTSVSTGDLKKLFRLIDENYRIIEIVIAFDKSKEPKTTVNLKLRRNNEVITLSSSQEEFISYVIHLQNIPHIKDDDADFVYIEKPNDYFDLQEKIVDLLGEGHKELIVCERKVGKKCQKFTAKIKEYERKWILSEKNIRIFPTKLCQIFYDVGILMIRDS